MAIVFLFSFYLGLMDARYLSRLIYMSIPGLTYLCWMLMGFFQNAPMELEEAALVTVFFPGIGLLKVILPCVTEFLQLRFWF